MLSKTRFSIPKTTLAYIAILVVLVVGAIMREINLLIILAGMMAGPLVISWQMIRTNLKQLKVRRRLPRGVAWGTMFEIKYAVTNRRKHIDTWALVLEDPLRNVTFHDSKTERGVCFLPRVPVGSVRYASFPACLTRRGRYRFGPLRISTKVPIGLLQGIASARIADEMLVYPQMGYLLRGWRELVHFDRRGQQQTQRLQGRSEGDFFGLRDWRVGDSRRWIHWRSSAKRNDLVVRQFEQQRSQDLVLLLDLTGLSETEAATAETRQAVELAVSLTATAAAEHCRRGSGRLTLRVAGRAAGELRGAAGPGLMIDALELLAEAVPGSAGQTPYDLLGRLPALRREDRVVMIRPGTVDPERWTGGGNGSSDGQTIHGAVDLGRAVRLNTRQKEMDNIFSWDDPHVKISSKHEHAKAPKHKRQRRPNTGTPSTSVTHDPTLLARHEEVE